MQKSLNLVLNNSESHHRHQQQSGQKQFHDLFVHLEQLAKSGADHVQFEAKASAWFRDRLHTVLQELGVRGGKFHGCSVHFYSIEYGRNYEKKINENFFYNFKIKKIISNSLLRYNLFGFF
jgi:hypothetical protein